MIRGELSGRNEVFTNREPENEEEWWSNRQRSEESCIDTKSIQSEDLRGISRSS